MIYFTLDFPYKNDNHIWIEKMFLSHRSDMEDLRFGKSVGRVEKEAWYQDSLTASKHVLINKKEIQIPKLVLQMWLCHTMSKLSEVFFWNKTMHIKDQVQKNQSTTLKPETFSQWCFGGRCFSMIFPSSMGFLELQVYEQLECREAQVPQIVVSRCTPKNR